MARTQHDHHRSLHPIRIGVVRHLRRVESPASPNQMAKLMGVSVGSVAYHVRMLRDHGYIVLVKRRQRRGATEHFYRLTKKAAEIPEALGDVAEEAARWLEGSDSEQARELAARLRAAMPTLAPDEQEVAAA